VCVAESQRKSLAELSLRLPAPVYEGYNTSLLDGAPRCCAQAALECLVCALLSLTLASANAGFDVGLVKQVLSSLRHDECRTETQLALT
jgi:hypothetical protein